METGQDDYAAMLAELELRMPREDIAEALGVGEDELDEIASGYAPDDAVASRLRALAASGAPRRVQRIPTRAVVIFVIADAIFFAALAAVLLLR